MTDRHDDLVKALENVEQAPASMVNDSDSLRWTIKTMQNIARAALSADRGQGKGRVK